MPNMAVSTGGQSMTRHQEILIERINNLCEEKRLTYYMLAYKASIPMNTLMHIMKGESKNPGFFTIVKICDGLEVSLSEFFDTKEFVELLKEVDGK